MKVLVAFARFWYDFIVGDDWKIAASVVITLGILVALLRTGTVGDGALPVLGGVLLMTAFTASVLIDVRGVRK